ncbi:unnamed protein product [Phytophthora lilii]|uniref:Unnamed protein product n=1 Tax=Phytophthora lilii TaxID=2077276 RepID=A0A9W6TLI2_9STRA|nr:unnamed protein product [Phytophthora lilii]
MGLVKPITSDHDLIELAKRIGVHLDDILKSEITHPFPKKGSYLILLRQPNMDAEHWTAFYNGETSIQWEKQHLRSTGSGDTIQNRSKVLMETIVEYGVCIANKKIR